MVVWIEILTYNRIVGQGFVTTCVVVWIEIITSARTRPIQSVTTCVVVWIEIVVRMVLARSWKSPPAWWCGLKLLWHRGLL